MTQDSDPSKSNGALQAGSKQARGLRDILGASPQLSRSNILIIDDDLASLLKIKEHLAHAGFQEFVGLSDPGSAIEAMQVERPSLVLLDLVMPQINGFDVLAQARKDATLRNIPIVVMTAATDNVTKLKLLELGATDVLSKPVDPSELALRVRNTLAFKAWSDRAIHFDPLTGLPNRRFLLEQISSQIRRCGRKNSGFAIAHIDLNRFGSINDAIGHPSADQLLISVAERIQACTRGHDFVASTLEQGGGLGMARLGGDQFVVVLPETDGVDGITRASQRLLQALARPFHVGDQEILLSANIGISQFPDDGKTADIMLRQAELATRDAKRVGPRTVRFFSPDLHHKASETLAMENALYRAVKEKSFKLLYQPKVEMRSLQIVGAEALIRWNEPQFESTPPEEFLRAADRCGLSLEIGQIVIEQACAQQKRWSEAGIRDLNLSINISAQQLRSEDFTNYLQSSIDQHGLKASSFSIEIKEQDLSQRPDDVATWLSRISACGVNLAIDDFGAGYSSLSQLRKCRLAELKIHRKLIEGLPKDRDSLAIIGATIALARNLGVQVTAKGVENEKQMTILQQLGCQWFQGFFRSKPIPADSFTNLLR